MGVTHRHLAHPLDVRATAQQHGVANNQTNKNEGESRPDQTKANDQTNEKRGVTADPIGSPSTPRYTRRPSGTTQPKISTMRHLIILFPLFFTTTLPAQFSVYLEQGVTVSDNINHKPIGLGLDYQLATWKGFDFSVGMAFDQITIETDLPLVDGAVTCPNASFFCNFTGADVKSRESRVFLPLRISRRAGRFTYGLELRPGLRVHDAIDLTYPILFSDIAGETQTAATRYGEGVPRSLVFQDVGEYTVNTSAFRVQYGVNLAYDLSERLSFGLTYRYEGFINEEVEVSLGDFYGAPREVDPVYFRGRSRVHYLVATVGWRL